MKVGTNTESEIVVIDVSATFDVRNNIIYIFVIPREI